jgi:hypothetical protein
MRRDGSNRRSRPMRGTAPLTGGGAPWRRRAQVAFWDQERAHRPARPWPTTLLFRVRYEVLLALLALAVPAALNQVLPRATTVAVVCVLIGGGFSVPPLRAAVTLLWWHVMTAHQIRRCCGELGIYNRAGRLPMILWTRTRAEGQLVTLWCRTGTSPQDFAQTTSLFRTACWAEAVEVRRHPRGEPLMYLWIGRRPGIFNADDRGETAAQEPPSGDGDWAARAAIPSPRAPMTLRAADPG